MPLSQRWPRSLAGAQHRSQKLTAFVSASLPAVYVTFKLEPEPTTVYQGHTAMFQCQAEGDPMPHIQWKGKDKILDPGKLLPRYTASVPNRNVARRGVPRAYPARGCRWCGLGFPAWGAHGRLSPCPGAWTLLASGLPFLPQPAKLQLSLRPFALEPCTA